MKRRDLFAFLAELSQKEGVSLLCKTDDLTLDFSYSMLSQAFVDQLQDLSRKLDLVVAFNRLFGANKANASESCSVDYLQLRSGEQAFYTSELSRLLEYTHKLNQAGRYKHVVQLGIGGSYLGPSYLNEALSGMHVLQGSSVQRTCHFVISPDPIALMKVLDRLDLDETLFVVASKSGSTYETIRNLRQLERLWEGSGRKKHDLKESLIALTMPNTALDDDSRFHEVFYIQEGIGGRFSTLSVMGLTSVALCFGMESVHKLLKGAAALDTNALNATVCENLSLLAAWETVWQRNIQKYPARVVIAYASCLAKLPCFVQQLSCESNGKAVNRQNEKVSYGTSPLIIPAEGPAAQHSFFQQVHQGMEGVPVEFISCNMQGNNESDLLALNVQSQQEALMEGRLSKSLNDDFEGGRPSTHLCLNRLTPEAIGASIAFYENKTVYEGFIWDLNSFDQPGVQLGKDVFARHLNT